jgi:hypothetical protein
VGEEQVQQVLDAAERISVSLTGYTGFDRDLSQEILAVVLTTVSAEQQNHADLDGGCLVLPTDSVAV